MFIGSINQQTRSVLAEMAPQWKGRAVYVGCSGNFTVERILVSAGIEEIHSNDVSLYSTTLGCYLAGQPQPDIRIMDPNYEWLTEYMDPGLDAVATLLVCSSWFENEGKPSPHYERLARAYRVNFAEVWKSTREKIARATEGVTVTSYMAMDVMDFVGLAPDDSVFISFPPTYKGGYEKLYRKMDAVFDWARPEYKEFDTAMFGEFQRRILEKETWVTLRDHDVEGLEPYLRARVKPSKSAKPVRLYSNAAIESPRITEPSLTYAPIRIPRATDPIEGPLAIVPITGHQLNTLRAQYLSKSITPMPTKWNFGVLAGGKLVGAIGLDRTYSWCSLYMMADLAIAPTPHKKLAKLVLVAALSTELQEIMEAKLGRHLPTLGTTAFTKKPTSMKYRGLFKLINRKPDSLTYIADTGRWSLAEGFDWWLQNHSEMR